MFPSWTREQKDISYSKEKKKIHKVKLDLHDHF